MPFSRMTVHDDGEDALHVLSGGASMLGEDGIDHSSQVCRSAR
jgi:hypothetical protein